MVFLLVRANYLLYVVFQVRAFVFDVSLPQQLIEKAANNSHLCMQEAKGDFVKGYVEEAVLKGSFGAFLPHPLSDVLALPPSLLASFGPTKATGAPLSFACIR